MSHAVDATSPRAAEPARDAAHPRVDVLGVGISVTSLEHTLATIAGWIERGERRYVCVTPVAGVMACQDDPELLDVFNGSGLTVPDGMPMVWAGRYAGAREISRVYGPDLMEAVCALASKNGWRSFLYGGGTGTAELLAHRLSERFPGLEIAGTHTPPFGTPTAEEDADIVERINASGAELVWVGLPTPAQDRWMAEHLVRLTAPKVLIGVGAAFDVHSGRKRPPPRWMGPLGLYWLYRLAQEPRRLWRRYLVQNPRFVAKIVRRPPELRPGTPNGTHAR